MSRKSVLQLLAVLGLGLPLTAKANVVGNDIQNFNPTTNGIDFVTVQSSETLEPGIFNFGFFLNYAVNVLPNYQSTTGQSRTQFEDTLLGGDLNFGVGLLKNWDFGFSAPQVYDRTSKDSKGVYKSKIVETGLTEYRLNSKYRFFGDDSGGLAFVGGMNIDRTHGNPFSGTNPGPTYNFELAWDTTIRKYAVGLNAGYRKRSPGTQIANVPIEPLKDQYIASAAVSYLLNAVDTKLIGEVFGAFPAKESTATTDRELSSMEILIGIKKDLRHDLAFHAGAGTELYHGSSSPDWRVYTGINWTVGPFWKKASSPESFGTEDKEESESFTLGEILFATGSDEITPRFQSVLQDLAKYMKSLKSYKTLTIEGHTDSVGADAYNLDLSQRRATAAVKYLVDKEGLPAAKLKGIGYGEERPIADNGNYQGRAKNRRLEIQIQK